MLLHKPKAVIFDFGGVLCFHPPDQRFAPIAEMFGIPTPELIRLFWATRGEYDAGVLDAREYWGGIARQAGRNIDGIDLPRLIRLEVELWNNYDNRVMNWAAQLHASGIRTAILSNLPPALGVELRATPGFLDRFDHVTFSFEIGVIKPHPKIYQDTICGLRLHAGEALFLDDRPDNVEGGRATGLIGEVFESWENFLETGLPRYNLPAPTPDVARFQ